MKGHPSRSLPGTSCKRETSPSNGIAAIRNDGRKTERHGPPTTGEVTSPISMPPPEQTHHPNIPIRIMQVILTDLAVFRQQLVPSTHWQICDYQDEAVLSTLNVRLLWARSRTYHFTRDQYRAHRGALRRWRSTTPTSASHVWALHKASFRQRGTLLKNMWDQWWHGENKAVAGLLHTQCPLFQATTCSKAHILCVCPVLKHLWEDHLRSLTTANTRFPQGPQRQLIVQYLDMVKTWLPLDERVLFWTVMLSKPQRSELTLVSVDFLSPVAGLSLQVRAVVWCRSRRLTTHFAAFPPPLLCLAPRITGTFLKRPHLTHLSVLRLRLLH